MSGWKKDMARWEDQERQEEFCDRSSLDRIPGRCAPAADHVDEIAGLL